MNQHISKMIDKIMNDDALCEELVRQKSPEDVYNFCIEVEKGYTQDELWEFIENTLEQDIPYPEEMEDVYMNQVTGGQKARIFTRVMAYSLSALTMMTAVNMNSEISAVDSATPAQRAQLIAQKEPSFWQKYKRLLLAAGALGLFALGGFAVYKYKTRQPGDPVQDSTNQLKKDAEKSRLAIIKDLQNRLKPNWRGNLPANAPELQQQLDALLARPADKPISDRGQAWYNSLWNSLYEARGIGGLAAGAGLTVLLIADASSVAKKITHIGNARYTFNDIWESMKDWRKWVANKMFAEEYNVNDAFHNLDILFEEIKGQEKAKAQVKSVVYGIIHKRNQEKLTGKKPERGNVLYFAGPSGVGKTLMAEGLVTKKILTANPEPFAISASIIDKDSTRESIIDQLFGLSYGGYGGYGGYGDYGDYGGSGRATAKPKNLVKYINDNPDGVVIINEYDKMWSPGLDEIFRSVLDGGKINVKGQTIDCSGITFILTSNESVKSITGGNQEIETKDEVDDGTGSRTSIKHDKSFLNRLKIIEFENLDAEEYAKIAKDAFKKYITSYWSRPDVANIDVVIGDECMEKLSHVIEKRNQGARPIFTEFESNLSRDISMQVKDAAVDGYKITKIVVGFDSASEEFSLDVSREILAN